MQLPIPVKRILIYLDISDFFQTVGNMIRLEITPIYAAYLRCCEKEIYVLF